MPSLKVSIIFAITLTAIAIMWIGVKPGIAAQANKTFNLSGTLIVVNKTDNTVSFIDLASASIIKTLPTGKGPHELVVSENGKWAVSTDFVGGDSLTVFDIENMAVARTIPLPKYPGPHGISFLPNKLFPNNDTVVFTSGKSQHVGIANIHTGVVSEGIKTAQNTTHMLAIDNKENALYTTNIRSNTLTQIDLKERAVLRHINTDAMPEAININQAQGQLWYGANKDGLVTVLDLSSKKELATFKGFSFPYRVLFSPSNKLALVPDFRQHNIRFFDLQTLKEVAKIDLGEGAGPQGITLHKHMTASIQSESGLHYANQEVAYLSLNLQNKVVAIDINTQKVIASFPTGNNPDGIGYSPLVLTHKN